MYIYLYLKFIPEHESFKCKKLSDEETRLKNCVSQQGNEIKKLQGKSNGQCSCNDKF